MKGKLVLKDGTVFEGISVGYPHSVAGEVVFTTGMVGYPESITDPSYEGQILVFTYPLIGNYGVPDASVWESGKIHVSALVVSCLINDTSHHESKQSLPHWLRNEHIPALQISDTRAITQKLRESGAILGKIIIDGNVDFFDPNTTNLVAKVSVNRPKTYGVGKRRVVLIDCGAKDNIIRSLVKRGVAVTVVPWNFDLVQSNLTYDGVVVSNGPGDPKQVGATIRTVAKLLKTDTPILGICLGNQMLALAAGGDTFKLKFGHRSQNQPCRVEDGTNRYFLTTQNHGYAVGTIPSGFCPWFTNANDGTNEGIIHEKKPFMSVQFHPEACPGPTDTGWVFDEFLKKFVIVKNYEIRITSMKQSIIQKKSYDFALRIIKLYIYLKDKKREYVLSKQVLRSGTATGAIIEEALGGQSQKDFLSKISIAYKEARETHYWLRLLFDSGFITSIQFENIESDLQEVLRILGKIQLTMKKKLKTRNS